MMTDSPQKVELVPTSRPTVVMLVFGVVAVVAALVVAIFILAQQNDNQRQDAQKARAELTILRQQLDCRGELTTKLLVALAENSKAQDSLLLGGFKGQDASARVADLEKAQAALDEAGRVRAEVDQRCPLS